MASSNSVRVFLALWALLIAAHINCALSHSSASKEFKWQYSKEGSNENTPNNDKDNGDHDDSEGNNNSDDDSEGNNNSDDSDKSCSDECTDNVQMPNWCEYASDLWDDPSTPLEQRNNIGMARFLTPKHVLKAASLAKIGKLYKLSYPFTNSIPSFSGRVWYSALIHSTGGFTDPTTYYDYADPDLPICGSGVGYLDQRLMTSAIGNSGTQLDGLGHIYYANGANGDESNYLWHNGFTGTNILNDYGISYIGIEKLPPFFTKVILLDVAGYVGVDVLDQGFQIDTNVILGVLEYQSMSLDDFGEGDVVLLHTGWAAAYWYSDPVKYYGAAPGITLDTVMDIFSPKRVLLLGSDTWAVENVLFRTSLSIRVHAHWILCNGGFLYENLYLEEWVNDIRNGDAPFVGGFYWSAAQIVGGVGGLGTPVVVV